MLLYLSVEHGQIFNEAGYVCNRFILCVNGIHDQVCYKQLTGMCLDG